MKKSSILFTILSVLMIAGGFVLFIINGFTTVGSFGKAFSPALLIVSIVLFIGGAVCLAITLGVAGKNKMKSLMNSDQNNDDSFFGQTFSTIKKHLEKTNLELDNDIKDLKTKNNSRKCPNCGASNIDENGKCPYCGN